MFDFDGVILESADLKTRAFRKIFQEICPNFVEEAMEYHKKNAGLSRFVKFRHVYEYFLKKSLDGDQEKKLGDHFSDIVAQEILETPFVEGVLDFLASNKGRYLFFVASGTPVDELKAIAQKRGVARYFVELFGSPQTKGEIVEHILKAHHLKRSEMVFIGDAHSDWAAAQKTGTHFIAKTSEPDFLPECRYRMQDFTQINECLDRLTV